MCKFQTSTVHFLLHTCTEPYICGYAVSYLLHIYSRPFHTSVLFTQSSFNSLQTLIKLPSWTNALNYHAQKFYLHSCSFMLNFPTHKHCVIHATHHQTMSTNVSPKSCWQLLSNPCYQSLFTSAYLFT